jgi:hypothetical protein
MDELARTGRTDRRTLLAEAGTTVIAGLLCACGVDTPAASTSPGGRVNPLEQQVKVAALDQLLAVLSATTTYEESGNKSTLTSKINNSTASFPKDRILKAQPIYQNSDLLRIEWIHSMFEHITIGKAEIKNIKIGQIDVPPATPADRANGTQTKALVQLLFAERSTIVIPYLKTGRGSFDYRTLSGSDVKKYKIPIVPNISENQSYENGVFNLPIIKKHDGWQTAPGIYYPIRLFNADHRNCNPYRDDSVSCKGVYIT